MPGCLFNLLSNIWVFVYIEKTVFLYELWRNTIYLGHDPLKCLLRTGYIVKTWAERSIILTSIDLNTDYSNDIYGPGWLI